MSLNDINKYKKSEQTWESAEILLNFNYARQAVTLYWHSVRDLLFFFLESCNIEYESTADALLQVLKFNYPLSALRDKNKINFLYSVGTISEAEENFIIELSEALEYRKIALKLSTDLKSFIDGK